ncbi:MAG: flagellar assembly protein FliW [Ignavibacteria bacterium]|nr:flagellar assembly protein FliW [Ignavibacteria bacterium]
MSEKTFKGKRKIKTLQFGKLEIEPHHIFYFENGLFGFEDLREFVIIAEEETLPFKWLISLERPEIGFPLLSPWHIDLLYDPGDDFDLEKNVLMVIITLENENKQMTANMKAPVVFDVENQRGWQVILPTDKYSTNYVIPNKIESENK